MPKILVVQILLNLNHTLMLFCHVRFTWVGEPICRGGEDWECVELRGWEWVFVFVWIDGWFVHFLKIWFWPSWILRFLDYPNYKNPSKYKQWEYWIVILCVFWDGVLRFLLFLRNGMDFFQYVLFLSQKKKKLHKLDLIL